MRRKQGSLNSSDVPLPSPLTSRNPKARSSRSTSGSRGGSARPSSLSTSSLMPSTSAVAQSSASSRGMKRERSRSPVDSGSGSKRPRDLSAEADELENKDVETILLPSDIRAAAEPFAQDSPSDLPVLSPPAAQPGPSSPHASPHLAPVSSPSLAKLLHPVNSSPGERTGAHSSSSTAASGSGTTPGSHAPIVVDLPTESTIASSSKLEEPYIPSPPRADPEHLSAYSCPICFFPPTNATLTPCGHICCGSCLFTAVKTMTQRGALMPEACVARCPVCRAQIPGWDGKGGGVIGLKVRAVFSL